MFNLKHLLLIVGFCFVGCASPSPSTFEYAYEPRIDWPEDEYRTVSQWQGSNEVTGQAFLRTRGGDVKTGAGSEVILNPVTSYSTQFVDAIIRKTHGHGVKLTPELPDARINDIFRIQTADAEGRFAFSGVPEGDYYLYSTVTWESPSVYGSGLQMQGGWVFTKIQVSSEKANKHILNQSY